MNCLCCTFFAPDEQLFSVNLQVRRQVKKTNVYMFQVQKITYFWKFCSWNRSWQKKRMSNYQSYSSFRISQIGATLTCRQYWVAFRTFWHKFSQQKFADDECCFFFNKMIVKNWNLSHKLKIHHFNKVDFKRNSRMLESVTKWKCWSKPWAYHY